MGWRGFIDDDSETVFFWSQKAACTTLFNFLADNMPERPTNKRYFHTHSQPYPHCISAIHNRGYRSVILARHPVNRIISAYFNKFCVYRGKRLLARTDLEPFAQDLHDLYCRRTGAPADENSMSFEQFLDTVAALHAARPGPRHPVNGHWETQVPPFHANLELQYDVVVHVERLDAEMAALAKDIGMRFDSRAMNRTDLTETPVIGYLGQVPAKDVGRLEFGYENFIAPLTLKRIHALYAVDFKVLGYPLNPSDQRGKTGLARFFSQVTSGLTQLTKK
ncbi:sulfotransferase family 2 domain-containing protein [uncultured Roseovarius sp.]|uniref:sulfotransferase family 2 domain-containing protein n=1 Tax=uncultured Roseovarius sp. TaxID=293344 RepID=UPI002606E613|nr:sulfotransferase family 2 domain-containing protein [uncultured Roseovarius sp.]